jgi:predicted RNA-binding protein
MKEFRLTKGVWKSFCHYNKKVEHVSCFGSRVVLSDVLGSKDVVEGRDGRTDGRTRRIVIERIRVKTELHA